MSSRGDERIRFGLLALVPAACCALPVLLATSLGLTAVVLGGAVAAAIAATGLLTVVVVRRRTRAKQPPVPGADNGRGADTEGSGPEVEVLYFDGCPNHVPALDMVERVARELGIEPKLRLVKVADHEAAQRLRFLGSPTIRVGGVDVDPTTEQRSDYALSCRVFRTEAGIAGQPDERWVREALLRWTATPSVSGGTVRDRRLTRGGPTFR